MHARPNAGQFQHERDLVSIGGIVTGEHGVPLAGAPVQVQSSEGGLVHTTYTDLSGHFSIGGLRPGNYDVSVTVDGYETGHWPVAIRFTSVLGLTFSLTPSTSESGKASPNGSDTVSVRELKIPGKARKEFEKAVASEAHGKTDEAVKHWKKSIEIYPRYAESYMELSRVYADRSEFAEATAAAERAVAIDGKNARSYTSLGYVFLKEKNLSKAKQAFEHAVRLSDTDWFSEFWVGQILLVEKDPKDAYPHLLRASQLHPQLPDVYVLLYNDLLMLGRGKEALAQLDQFLKRFPQNPLAEKAREKRKELEKSLAAGTN